MSREADPHVYYLVEDGRDLARLEDPRHVDMFWHAFRLVVLSSGLALSCRLHCDEFWDRLESSRITFRHEPSGELCQAPIPAPNPGRRLRETGRITLRAMYRESEIKEFEAREKQSEPTRFAPGSYPVGWIFKRWMR